MNNTIVRNERAGIFAPGSAIARNNIVQENGVGLSGSVTSSYNDVSDGYYQALRSMSQFVAASIRTSR